MITIVLFFNTCLGAIRKRGICENLKLLLENENDVMNKVSNSHGDDYACKRIVGILSNRGLI